MMPRKYIVIIAHADGWGVLNVNGAVRRIHTKFPKLGIHLIVSQATKNKIGAIATKLDDLKIPRQLKETNLLDYFARIDDIYGSMLSEVELNREWSTIVRSNGKSLSHLTLAEQAKYCMTLGLQMGKRQLAELLTFQELAKKFCRDGKVHYTSRGGFPGGEEVASIIEALERHNDRGPELLLSLDTMAILPRNLLERYHCFSAHPGPLDTIKIEGMQGTLRSLVNQVYFDENGIPLPDNHIFGMGMAYIKGTLFMQLPALDAGPALAIVQTPVCPGMSAYKARDEIYAVLIDTMLKLLPQFLRKKSRAILIKKAFAEKEILNSKPTIKIPELDAEQLAKWQGQAIGIEDDSQPWGIDIIQNQILDSRYFRGVMRRFFPGSDAEFDNTFTEIYGGSLAELAEQSDRRLTDSWARLYSGRADSVLRQYKPGTMDVIAQYTNIGPSG
jgi:hypothetical protein